METMSLVSDTQKQMIKESEGYQDILDEVKDQTDEM